MPNCCGHLNNGGGHLSNRCGRLNTGGGHLSNCCGCLNTGAGTSVLPAFCFETYKDTIVHQYSGWKFIWIGKLDSNYHICIRRCGIPVLLANTLRSSVDGNGVRFQVSSRMLRCSSVARWRFGLIVGCSAVVVGEMGGAVGVELLSTTGVRYRPGEDGRTCGSRSKRSVFISRLFAGKYV